MEGPKIDTVDIAWLSSQKQSGYCASCRGEDYQNRRYKFSNAVLAPATCQKLVERGWARNGSCFIKPIPSCCFNWQIRLDATKFQPNKKQRKIVRRLVDIFNSPEKVSLVLKLLDEECPEEILGVLRQSKNKEAPREQPQPQMSETQRVIDEAVEGQLRKVLSVLHDKVVGDLPHFVSAHASLFLGNEAAFGDQDLQGDVRIFAPRTPKEHYYCNYGALLFSLHKKNLRKGVTLASFMTALTVHYAELCSNISLEFRLRFDKSGYLIFDSHTHLKSQSKTSKRSKKSQKMEGEREREKMEGEKQKCTQASFSWDQIHIGELDIFFMPAEFEDGDFELYAKYQAVVHNSFLETHQGYINFLCCSNLTSEVQETSEECFQMFKPHWEPDSAGLPIGGHRYQTQGCYHMKYYLRGRLIAINVVDILPGMMVSSYFLYEPVLKNQSIAVFSAIVDIEWVRWMSLSFPGFRYYSLSYYIQNSEKLKYKNQYRPFEILCPRAYRWVQFDHAIKSRIDEIIRKERQCQLCDEPPIDDMQLPPGFSEQALGFPSFSAHNAAEWQCLRQYEKCKQLAGSYIAQMGKELSKLIRFAMPAQLLREIQEYQAQWLQQQQHGEDGNEVLD